MMHHDLAAEKETNPKVGFNHRNESALIVALKMTYTLCPQKEHGDLPPRWLL